jgi:hypothetical protein
MPRSHLGISILKVILRNRDISWGEALWDGICTEVVRSAFGCVQGLHEGLGRGWGSDFALEDVCHGDLLAVEAGVGIVSLRVDKRDE